MATEEIPPGSALNQVPSEPPADPPHTDSSSATSQPTVSTPSATAINSTTAKPYKLNSSSPSPVHTAQVPLQVHVPAAAALAAGHPAARSLPAGGLLAQSPYAATAFPAGQPGLMPLPFGQQFMAAGAIPRVGLQHLHGAALPGLPPAPQPMLLPGGGLMRHQRRTMAPVAHPYQRYQTALPGAAATQPVQHLQMLTAARAAVAPQQAAVQTPYGQMFIPVSAAGLQYRMPVPQAMQAQAIQAQAPAMAAMDPTTAALYAGQAPAFQPYLQQFQHPTMAAMAAAAAASQQATIVGGAQPHYLRATAHSEHQPLATAAAYDQQKLLNAQYAQMLMPDQNNISPATAGANALNGTTAEYGESKET